VADRVRWQVAAASDHTIDLAASTSLICAGCFTPTMTIAGSSEANVIALRRRGQCAMSSRMLGLAICTGCRRPTTSDARWARVRWERQQRGVTAVARRGSTSRRVQPTIRSEEAPSVLLAAVAACGPLHETQRRGPHGAEARATQQRSTAVAPGERKTSGQRCALDRQSAFARL
jgi:hypothetical protein